MQHSDDLVFFDKAGVPYNFDYDADSGMWTGSIYIRPVSKGLFETEKIIVIQRYLMKSEDTDQNMSNPVNTYEYGYPESCYGPEAGDSYVFEWDPSVKEVDEIRLFSFDKGICPPEDTSSLTFNEYDCPEPEFAESISVGDLVYEPVSYAGAGVDPQTGMYTVTYRKEPSWSYSCACVDICFRNVDDPYSTFRRDLIMYYSDINGDRYPVGRFCVYAKSVEEDERLTTMCENLGYDINTADYGIFQDSDIKEQVVDNVLMNEKRKEIVMEGCNIYPYIGSYKALINAIRFFGYDNISIKEWWKNADASSEHYGRHFLASKYSLKDREVIREGTVVSLPSEKYRKTGKLTLAYRINDLKRDSDNSVVIAESSYPGHAYPETDEKFAYTIEEAVIKLYGLKRKLEKEFLPLTSRIIDIVGESDAFYAGMVKTTPSQSARFDGAAGPANGFSVLGSQDGCFYIEDLRPFGIHPEELAAGDGIVGERRSGPASFIGNYNSFYDVETGTDVTEFGRETIGGYNIGFDGVLNDGAGLTGSYDFQGYAEDWDINRVADVKMTGGMADIEAVAGSAECDYTGTDIPPRYGPVAPYAMTGDSLFAVVGDTAECCRPWMYYLRAADGTPGNYYLAEFSRWYPNLAHNSTRANEFDDDFNTHLPDNENIPVGALVELAVDSDEAVWNDVKTLSWTDFTGISWAYIDLFADNLARVEWTIHKDADETPAFDFEICGVMTDGYGDIGVVLPYVGSYDVTMRLYDWNNGVKVVKKTGGISVCPKEVEFTGWCRMRAANPPVWNDMRSASFNGMDRGAFLGQYANASDPDERVLIYNFAENIIDDIPALSEDNRGPYFWNNLDVAWRNMDHLTWDMMNITGDIPCYFAFGYFDASGNPVDSPDPDGAGAAAGDSLPSKWLEIADNDNNFASFKFPRSSSSDLNYIADVVRQLNETDDPVIGKFYYSYIWQSHTSDPSLDIPNGFRILAVSKNHGETGDIKYVGIVSDSYYAYRENNALHVLNDPGNKQLVFWTNSVISNPGWLDTVCINNVTEIPAYTDVNFNYTNCRINGKKNPVWTFRNLNSGLTFTSMKKNYHRMFRDKGCWEVTLRLNDTNGNTYFGTRNMFIVK